jgi:hypothetical protein
MTLPLGYWNTTEHKKWLINNIIYKLQSYQDEIIRSKDIAMTMFESYPSSAKEKRNRVIAIMTFVATFVGFNTILGNLSNNFIFLIIAMFFSEFILLAYIYYSIRLKRMNNKIDNIKKEYLKIIVRLDFFKGFISSFAMNIENINKDYLEYFINFIDYANINRIGLIAALNEAVKDSIFDKSKSELENSVIGAETTMATYYNIYGKLPRPSSLFEKFTLLDPFYDQYIQTIIDKYDEDEEEQDK